MRVQCCAFFLILFMAVASPAADNRAVANAAFDELIGRDFTSLAKRFSPGMSSAMSAEKLAAAGDPILNSLGALLSGRPEAQVTSSRG